MRYFLRRLPRRLEKIAVERLTEPVHLNLAALLVAVFGSYQHKVAFDLVLRPQYAYGLLAAATRAQIYGIRRFTAVELGVASGAGLLNMAALARRTTKATGVEIDIVGFDTGKGLPPPADYRDHPESYAAGDYPMDEAALRRSLPDDASLYIGDVADTISEFHAGQKSPVGFIALDVDTYTSSASALEICNGDPSRYLPETLVYVDDIAFLNHNPWAGELLAIEEFNATHDRRKIAPYRFLRSTRVFKNAAWLDQIYVLHVLDHAMRAVPHAHGTRVIDNPLLKKAASN